MEQALIATGTLVLVGGVFAIVMGVDIARYRRAFPGWQRAATALGGKLYKTTLSLRLETVVDGRPVMVKTHDIGRGRNARTHTTVATVSRHPDDVAAGIPRPPPDLGVWNTAWNDAHIRAGMADLPRPTLRSEGLVHDSERGVADGDEIVARIRGLVARLDAEERRLDRWTEAARSVDLTVKAAYFLEREVRGCQVRLLADVGSVSVVVRAIGVARGAADVVAIAQSAAPGGYEQLARASLALPGTYLAFAADPERAAIRITAAARTALEEAAPSSVVAEQQHATVVVPGLEPAPARWRAAIALAVELVAAPGDGPFRGS